MDGFPYFFSYPPHQGSSRILIILYLRILITSDLYLHDCVRNVVVHFPCLYLYFPDLYLYFHDFVWNVDCAFPRFPLLWRGFISLEADLLGRLASRLDFFCNPVSAILLHWLFIKICEIYWNLYWDDLLHELTFWQSWVPDTFARVVCNNMWSILELIGTTYTANITQPVCNSWSAAM